tara:strand:- start:39441 stop:39818 length:378 start_codon:yes stop_codon:yes gene_type:complete
MPALPITSLTAAIAAVALIVLSFLVSFRRMKVDINIGTGDDVALLKRIRAQGNFIEYVPITLILLALVEMAGAGTGQLWTISGLLLGGRLLHAVGMLGGVLPARGLGMLMTYAAMLMAIALLPLS